MDFLSFGYSFTPQSINNITDFYFFFLFTSRNYTTSCLCPCLKARLEQSTHVPVSILYGASNFREGEGEEVVKENVV